MLLGDPAQTPYDLRFRIFGFPVRVHPLFWLVVILLGQGTFRSRGGRELLQEVLLWVMAVFVSFLVHELGHAFVMRWYGYQPSITLYGFGGYAAYNGGRQPSLWAQIFISAAGPAAELLLMAGLAGVLVLLGYGIMPVAWMGLGLFFVPAPGEVIVATGLTMFVDNLMWISAVWAYFNLLPIYPMDGGHIARALLQLMHPREGVRLSLVLSIIVGGGMTALWFYSGSQFTAFFLAMMTVANVQALLLEFQR